MEDPNDITDREFYGEDLRQSRRLAEELEEARAEIAELLADRARVRRELRGAILLAEGTPDLDDAQDALDLVSAAVDRVLPEEWGERPVARLDRKEVVWVAIYGGGSTCPDGSPHQPGAGCGERAVCFRCDAALREDGAMPARSRPSAWAPLSFGSLPPADRSLLVTNNLSSRLANGQMAMLWLVSAVHYAPPRDGSREEFYAYTREGELIRWLTHWRLAVPESE